MQCNDSRVIGSRAAIDRPMSFVVRAVSIWSSIAYPAFKYQAYKIYASPLGRVAGFLVWSGDDERTRKVVTKVVTVKIATAGAKVQKLKCFQ